jgi:hypothetical protein
MIMIDYLLIIKSQFDYDYYLCDLIMIDYYFVIKSNHGLFYDLVFAFVVEVWVMRIDTGITLIWFCIHLMLIYLLNILPKS